MNRSAFVHVGQCGSQLGEAFWRELSRHAEGRDYFYHAGGERCSSKALFVDTEPKVVNAVGFGPLKLHPAHTYVEQSGRGGNWAYGYNHAESATEWCLDNLRKVGEACDVFDTVYLFHSLCGGTGSGVGSKLMEMIRDDFRRVDIASVCVAPFSYGESPLQHYNAVLTAQSLKEHCDLVMWFWNDWFCSNKSKDEKVSIANINASIVEAVAGVLLPYQEPVMHDIIQEELEKYGVHNKGAHLDRSCFDVMDVISALAYTNERKYVRVASAIENGRRAGERDTPYQYLVKQALQRLPSRWKDQRRIEYYGCQAVARVQPVRLNDRDAKGSQVGNVVEEYKAASASLKLVAKDVRLEPSRLDLRLSMWTSSGVRPLSSSAHRARDKPPSRQQRSLSLVSSDSYFSEWIEMEAEKAGAMAEEKAFLHWYDRHGVEADTIAQAVHDTLSGCFRPKL